MKAVDLRNSLHYRVTLALGLGVLDESTSKKLKSPTVQEAASMLITVKLLRRTDRQTDRVRWSDQSHWSSSDRRVFTEQTKCKSKSKSKRLPNFSFERLALALALGLLRKHPSDRSPCGGHKTQRIFKTEKKKAVET